jgi:hypothetical protein
MALARMFVIPQSEIRNPQLNHFTFTGYAGR